MASLQSHLVRLILKATGRRKRFESVAALKAEIAATRREDNLPPSPFPRVTLTGNPAAEGAVLVLSPPQPTDRHILYLHGGAWLFPPRGPHWDFLSRLCEETASTITMPLYPLGPVASHDTMMQMLEPVYAGLRERHADLSVMGDSAGAGLTLSLLQSNLPAPDRVVLISPPMDMQVSQAAIEASRHDPLLAHETLGQIGQWYAGDRPLDDPRVSPVHMDPALLPPCQIYMGTRDLLRPDLLRFLDRAGKAPITYHEGKGMIHVWPLLNALPEGRKARASMVDFLTG